MAGNRAHAVAFAIGPLVVLVTALGFAAPPLDADASGPMAHWFRSLRQPGTGVLCCDVSDCRQTIARRSGDGWEAQIPGGNWTPIPPGLILDDKAHPAGIAVLCWRPAAGVVCFIAPRHGG